MFVDKTSIDKDPGGLRVNESLYRKELIYVGSFNRGWKIKEDSTDIKSTHS